MCVLICKNTPAEGPGTIGEYLSENGIPHTVVELSNGKGLPDPGGFEALVMLGGPMSVNDEAHYPYITEEIELVRRFAAANKRILGVCLGAQIMAKALGAPVYRGSGPEIGWLDIELTVDGAMDHLFRKLATHPQGGDVWKRFKVFHWHGETFDIPQGAVRLASSALYRNQAFRFGARAYAFQFHIEVTPEIVCEWLKDEAIDRDVLRVDTEKYHEVCRGRAWNFFAPFFKGLGEGASS